MRIRRQVLVTSCCFNRPILTAVRICAKMRHAVCTRYSQSHAFGRLALAGALLCTLLLLSGQKRASIPLIYQRIHNAEAEVHQHRLQDQEHGVFALSICVLKCACVSE